MKKILPALIAPLVFAAAVITCVSCQGGDDGKDTAGKEVEPAKSIELTTRQKDKTAGDNAFAFNLFRELVAESGEAVKRNAFMSPFSVTMALGMLYNGTSPDAGAEMAASLGMADFTDAEINEYYRTLRRALLTTDPQTALAIANSIWYERTYPVKQSFIGKNDTYYDAEVHGLDFMAPETMEIINRWCSNNTYGRITKIYDRMPDAVMLLMNALYFKSRWEVEFKKEDTRKEDFTLADGTRKQVDMMNQTAELAYYRNEELQCVEMPYGNGAFSMLLVMPAAGVGGGAGAGSGSGSGSGDGAGGLDRFVESLDAEMYDMICASLYKTDVRVKLPRFRQECTFSLVEPVQNLGIQRIFADGNLLGIADDPRLVVSDIKQKTFVEVNEEGTEAAAVTVVETEVTSIGPGEVFFANRPFVYLIRESSTGAILFIGRMDEPQE